MDKATTRYTFIAITKSGEEFLLININPENNTGTYRTKSGKMKYLKLDDISIKMIEHKEVR